MQDFTAIRHFLEKALFKDLLFAVYSYPGQDKIHAIIQTDSNIRQVQDLDFTKDFGFVFSPYDSRKNASVWIQSDLYSSDLSKVIPTLPDSVQYSDNYTLKIRKKVSKEGYLDTIANLQNEMTLSQTSKVVLSRFIPFELDDQLKGDFFLELVSKNSDAFVYMVNLPGAVTYIGATPEMLLIGKDDSYSTTAMAGTRKYEIENEEITWTEKEKIEQSLVQEHIEEVLKEMQINFTKDSTKTMYLNSKLAHLRTNYHWKGSKVKLKSILYNLHPTPAICGTPKKNAIELIEKFEGYSRDYYTGFLGTILADDQIQLFVNLRCAALHDGKGIAYVGGGITADSNPTSEWLETELKSQTILGCIESGLKI